MKHTHLLTTLAFCAACGNALQTKNNDTMPQQQPTPGTDGVIYVPKK